MASPTKESIIGTFSNNGREQNDFLQLKNQSGGNIFGWIDYQGHLQGSLLQGVGQPAGSNTNIQFNNNGSFGASPAFNFDSTTSTLKLGVPASSLSALLRSYQAGSTQFFEQDIISTVATNPSGFINSLYILQQQDQVLAVNIYQDATTQDHPSGVFPLTVVPLITTSFLPASTFVTGVFSAPRFVGHLDCGTIAGYQSSLEDNTVPCTGNINTLYGYHCEFFTAATVQTAICFNADEINGNLNQGAAFNAVLYGGAVTDDGHSYGVYIKSGANYFGAPATTKAIQVINPTAATSLANQNSPSIAVTGEYWNGSASAADIWTIQDVLAAGSNPTSTLTFTHIGSSGNPLVSILASLTVSSTFNANVVVSPKGAFNFQGGDSGLVYTITSAASAVGALTTYQASGTGIAQLALGQYITVAGFTNGANNGRFIIQSSTSSSITVYNSSGVSETHAATGTIDTGYINTSGYNAYLGVNQTFNIQGIGYVTSNSFEALPYSPLITFNLKGDVTDSGYIRIINDGATGNHGLEIGAIIDGSGVNPAILQIGHFNGATTAVLNCPLTVKGSTPTGTTGQLSFGTTTATSASAGSNGDVPAQVVGYLVVDQAGTKIKIPYYAV